MPRRKLMLLGGLRYLLPVIDAAHNLGCHVITCDYLPDNIAHKYSDEYHNVSILDRDAVLSIARELRIDGIMSFAVDPGVVTAAYVADKMGLPQGQGLFRVAGDCQARGLRRQQGRLPCRQSGQTVSRVDSPDKLGAAFDNALSHSFSGKVIIEEFIEKLGCSSDSDCFSVDGELKFVSFSAQRFDENADNPYTPAAYSWPSTFTKEQEAELTVEIQRLLTLLRMRTSIYNIETRIGTNGKPYIMEVSPRGGGNRLAEMLRMATDVDMVTASVRAALGESVTDIVQRPYDGHWAEVILHADRCGTFRGLDISPEMSRHVVERDLWVREGAQVSSFNGANDAIGTLVMKFESCVESEQFLQNQQSSINLRIIRQ